MASSIHCQEEIDRVSGASSHNCQKEMHRVSFSPMMPNRPAFSKMMHLRSALEQPGEEAEVEHLRLDRRCP